MAYNSYLAFKSGVSNSTVQKIMGYADIRTSLRYTKEIDETVLDAVE